MDQALAELNAALNETYVAYGKEGEVSKANQIEQDRNASDMSAPSAASRAVAKAGRLYRNESWDLVDAMESGVAVEALEDEALPPELQAMSQGERLEYVEAAGGETSADQRRNRRTRQKTAGLHRLGARPARRGGRGGTRRGDSWRDCTRSRRRKDLNSNDGLQANCRRGLTGAPVGRCRQNNQSDRNIGDMDSRL